MTTVLISLYKKDIKSFELLFKYEKFDIDKFINYCFIARYNPAFHKIIMDRFDEVSYNGEDHPIYKKHNKLIFFINYSFRENNFRICSILQELDEDRRKKLVNLFMKHHSIKFARFEKDISSPEIMSYDASGCTWSQAVIEIQKHNTWEDFIKFIEMEIDSQFYEYEY